MASGILGTQASLAAATLTTVYTVPASTVSYLNLNMVNTNATPVSVRVALAATDTPTPGEYVEYNAEIGGYGVLERTGIALQANRKVVALADTTSLSTVLKKPLNSFNK